MTHTGPEISGFTLDRFQLEAIEAIDADRSVLVAAPTGSGKTVVAEHAVRRALAQGRKAFYTTPIKALSNQKFADLKAEHGTDKVGLLTGDNAVNGDAPVVVMTTEVLRNMIYARSGLLQGLSVVILDEVHYLQDPYRGPVWEEVIIHAPHDVKLVCLSATVSNADELAAWITEVRGPTSTVVEHQRPIELENLYAAHDKATRQTVVIPTLDGGRPNPMGERFDADEVKTARPQRGRPRRRFATPRRLEVVDHLKDHDLLPAIFFIFSRAACDDAAAHLLDSGVRLTTPDERLRIRTIVEERTATLTDGDLDVLGYDRWLAALELGIAAHHAGMVPPFKEAVEACFVQGLAKVVFATETLALGINMPARSVVIENLSKFTGESHQILTPAEYTQLTGRAGRRGIDEVGRALVLWSPFVPFDQVAALALSREFALVSAFRPTYNMAANLVRRYTRDDARRMLDRSFAQFQADRSVVKLSARADARREALERLEHEAHCEMGDIGEYRALLQADDEARRGTSPRAEVDRALARLRPGDVIAHKGRRLAVISVAQRKAGRVRVAAIAADGRSLDLDAADFDDVPERLSSIEMPVPFNPNNRTFQHDVARRLARSRGRTGGRSKGGGRQRVTVADALAPDHPVARCPDRAQHVRAAVQAERAQRELADLERRIGVSAGAVARRFDAVLALLERWDYVEDWALTDRGQRLVRIYHESDLLVAEAICAGLFDDLDAPAVAALASCLTYEHRSRVPPPPPWFPHGGLRDRFERLDRLGRDLERAEQSAGLPTTRRPDPTFVPLAHAWALGTELDEVLHDEDLSGGDFVRNVRQLIDLLRQVGEAATRSSTRHAAREAADRLFRGVVSASAVLSGLAPGGDDTDETGTA